MILETSEIYLRALEPNDYKTTIKWHKDPEVWKTILGTEYIVSEAYEKQWIEKAIFDPATVRCAICLKETDEMIGLMSLCDFNYQERNCRISGLIGKPELFGKGYCTHAVNLMLGYAFNNRNMVRVSTRILDTNIASKKVITRSGAKHEGTLRKAVFKDGEYHDVLIYGVLAEEYIRLD